MPKKTEAQRYELRRAGMDVSGEWDHYDVVLNGSNATGRTVVGGCTRRAGGGWICTLPIFGVEDNGIADVRRKVGYAKGRGGTPQEALDEADRIALRGPEGVEEYAAREMF